MTDIGNLQDAVQRLNAASDAVMAELGKAAVELKRIGVGVAAYVTVPGDDAHEECEFGYEKLDGRWGFTVSWADAGGVEQVAHMDAVPRHLRMRAARHLPKLLEELLSAVQALCIKAQVTVGVVVDSVAALREVKP